MPMGVGLSCGCCNCCNTCIEADVVASNRTSIQASLEFVDATGSFTLTPLSEGGTNPIELPATISAGGDINGYEMALGYISCDHTDITCLRKMIEAFVEADSDTVSLNDSGNSNGNLCEVVGGTVNYANGGSTLSIPLRVFTFSTGNGKRYVGAYLVKDDSDAANMGQIQQAGWNEISASGRATCDGVDETVTLSYLDNDYDGTTCNNVGGFTETVTYTQVRIRLTVVP